MSEYNIKLKVMIRDSETAVHEMTDVEWGELRKIGWYFDVINGDMRQVIQWSPDYEERICQEAHIVEVETSEFSFDNPPEMDSSQ